MNFEQPKSELTSEEIKIALQADKDEFERVMKVFSEASDQFHIAEKQYGHDDPITQDKKKQWDYVERAKKEVEEKINQDIKDFPEHKEMFKI